MTRIQALLKLIDTGRATGEELISRVPENEREGRGTFEKWSAKDAIAHISEWLTLLFIKIDTAARPPQVEKFASMEASNRSIFEKHSGESWNQVRGFFAAAYDEAAARMDGSAIEALRDLNDDQIWLGNELYTLARHYAKAGNVECAVKNIKNAIDLSPELIERLKNDQDLAPIRNRAGFGSWVDAYSHRNRDPIE